MNIVFILLLLLVSVPFTMLVIAAAFESSASPRRRVLATVASVLLAVGGLGFFGTGLSALGGLDWAGSFEWPVGYATNVVTVPGDFHALSTPSGRVQVYDAQWRFVRGWHISHGDGPVRLIPLADGSIDVYTAKGQARYHYTLEGQLLNQGAFSEDFESLPKGDGMFVPTRPWLWVFSHPFISWGLLAGGLVMFGWIDRTAPKRRRRKARAPAIRPARKRPA